MITAFNDPNNSSFFGTGYMKTSLGKDDEKKGGKKSETVNQDTPGKVKKIIIK